MSDAQPTPGQPIHFEIHAADPARATEFYTSVFGWETEDWSEFAGMPYFGLKTGEGPGIDGAVMQRHGPNPEPGAAVAGAVLTIGVESFDDSATRILAAGGTVAMPKAALPGMAWQGYFLDLDGNVFGVHEPDPDAK
ncbi:VOC family protein [Leucobacter luti]|uniref:VOC family protein n=1 Tax=Leucobacter luti TaxID=340320 RepID=UPI003D02EFCE